MKMAAHDGQVPGIKYGTVQYLAPEVLNTHIMTKKADVYSFGIIMWEVWHSRLFAEFYNNEKRKRKQCVCPLICMKRKPNLQLSMHMNNMGLIGEYCAAACSDDRMKKDS